MNEIFKRKRFQSLAVLLLLASLAYGTLYFLSPQINPLRTKLQYLPDSNIYSIETEINNNKYLLEVDTGAECFLTLHKEILEKIPNKKLTGTSQWMDINGNKYLSKIFEINLIKFAAIDIFNVLAKEESLFFMTTGGHLHPDRPISKLMKKDFNKISGRIGSRLFINYNYWLIDLANRNLFPLKDNVEIENFVANSLKNFIKVPIEKNHSLIIISIDTDFGIKKFCLDTGSGRTILRTSGLNNQKIRHKKTITKKFIANGHNFGETELYLFDFPAQGFAFDGYIGLDFLEKHPILLNFKDYEALIGF